MRDKLDILALHTPLFLSDWVNSIPFRESLSMKKKLAIFVLLSGCMKSAPPTYVGREVIPREDRTTHVVSFIGEASYYGRDFHGKTTASGEPFDMNGLTAAHKKLPFGSIVRVTNLENGKEVWVRINDRGPYVDGRLIDLSKGAAREIGLLEDGVGKVKLDVYSSPGEADEAQMTSYQRRIYRKGQQRWKEFYAIQKKADSMTPFLFQE